MTTHIHYKRIIVIILLQKDLCKNNERYCKFQICYMTKWSNIQFPTNKRERINKMPYSYFNNFAVNYSKYEYNYLYLWLRKYTE